MATHILRPGVWSEQVQLLFPKLKTGDKLIVATHEQKAALDVLLVLWPCLYDVHVLVPAENDTNPGVCARCFLALKQGFAMSSGMCECDNHKQTCPKLWDGLTEASLKILANRHEGYTGDVSDISDVTVQTAAAPCNCGFETLSTQIYESSKSEYR